MSTTGSMLSRCVTAWFLTATLTALAYTPPQDTAGPLTIKIADPGPVTVLEKSIDVPVTVTNAGEKPVTGVVKLSVADEWRVTSDHTQRFSLAPKATQTLPFSVMADKQSYAALYPVHARAEFRPEGEDSLTAHAILILTVTPEAVAAVAVKKPAPTALRAPTHGPLNLLSAEAFQATIAVHDKPVAAKPAGWQGTDPDTGCYIAITDQDAGGLRHALGVHPPWRKGWGDALLDYHITLPDQKPISLEFATAIRESKAKEGGSDGVDFRVSVSDGGEFKQLFARFSDAKRWEPAQVDLSEYAGHEITLRLFTGPGPAHNTSCDQSFWAEPTIWVGAPPKVESDVNRAARREAALRAAQAALAGDAIDWTWKLESDTGSGNTNISAAAVVPGPNGLVDAFIAFASDKQTVVFDGFDIKIDNQPMAAGKNGLLRESVHHHFESTGRGVLSHQLLKGDRLITVQTTLWAEKGALRIAFAMPGEKRNERGEPRFSSLMIGPASEKAHRVYAGFGNVLQEPGKFDLHAGGFTLCTRHIGLDFSNGLSLVQAVDIFPDNLRVDPENHRYALVAHHDATFSFLPSSHGAFAAARAYRAIANFKPADGVASLAGRMCLDQWGGDYRKAAEEIDKAARYGLTDTIFVKHDWQRWGYDYRLPDIYPPSKKFDDFLAMVDACKRHGILFCPHDNYIDFYPDAEGYSYEHMIFNQDGTPQKAWFNEGRQALSYRWLPTAFQPWLDRNLKLMKNGFAPTAEFVDVFTAMPPVDFYDRHGRFYPKTVCAERWGAAFDRIRSVLGNHAPTISEAGTDALIGHLDAGESDHAGWQKDEAWHFNWTMETADAERIPWHDMATHRAFVLFAGGLGPRYAGKHDNAMHGYGSDDYLTTTVLGGRNPMCDGPFSRRAVMTYWLQHDLCAELFGRDLLTHEFAGDDIHRQSVTFSNNAFVRANRGTNDWQADGLTLPPYGFIARAGDCEADISRRDGIITASARRPGQLFVDARPPASDGVNIVPRVLGVESVDNRQLRIAIDWAVGEAVDGVRPFLHFVSETESKHEGTAFQGGLGIDPAKFAQPGSYSSRGEIHLPETVTAPATFAVRFGLYQPGSGHRLSLRAPVDPNGRVRGGKIHLDGKGRQVTGIRWEPEPEDPLLARLNSGNKMVDFGPVVTNGAFRLRYKKDSVELIPLPFSAPFKVVLRLDRLDLAGKVQSASILDQENKPAGDLGFQQQNQEIQFTHDGKAFGYQFRLAP